MYFGTIARLRVKSHMIDQFLAYGEEQSQRRDDTAVATIVFQSTDDPNEYFLVAVAESEEAYRAIAESPEQNEQYLRMVQFLQAEPEWHDGYVVFSQFPQTARR